MVNPSRDQSRVRLEERDIEILEHVFRYRMTVIEALENLGFFADDTPHAAKNVLRRLKSGGFLNSAPLYGNRRYYYLTSVAAHAIGYSEAVARPLPEQTKTDAFGMLAFCCLRDTHQEKLTLDEFRSSFPKLFRNGERPNYYLDTEGETKRLGFVRIDRGGMGRWDRLIARCRDDVAKRCDLPDFRRLIDGGAFVFTLLTALPQKAERLADAFSEDGFPCEIQVFSLPELLELVAPVPIR